MKDTYPRFKMELFFLGYVFFEFSDVVPVTLFLGDSHHGFLDPVHFFQSKLKHFLGGHAGGEVEVQTRLVEGFSIGEGGVGDVLPCVWEVLLQTSNSYWPTNRTNNTLVNNLQFERLFGIFIFLRGLGERIFFFLTLI